MITHGNWRQLASLLAALLPAAGCGQAIIGPTRQIESPDPRPRMIYTSAARGPVAQATYVEPIPAAEPVRIRPFAEWTEQEAAADALGRIGPTAVPALIEGLRSSDPDVRLRACEVLGRMGSGAKDAVPGLMPLLDDPDERIRKAAARTLGRIGPEAAPAVPALMRSLLEAEPAPPPVELQPVPQD
jgi:HEAT repeat protein